MLTELTSENQTTVPSEIANEMGLKPGARLDWARGDEPGTIVIRVHPSIREMLDRAQELGRRIKNRNLIEELIAERAAEMGVVYLRDTSAILTHCDGEPGAAEVDSILASRLGYVAAVTWLELRVKLQFEADFTSYSPLIQER